MGSFSTLHAGLERRFCVKFFFIFVIIELSPVSCEVVLDILVLVDVEGRVVGQEGVLLLSADSHVDPEPQIFVAITLFYFGSSQEYSVPGSDIFFSKPYKICFLPDSEHDEM